MPLDRQLIDTIKKHFSRKSSGQLQAIVFFDNQSRWSQEAIAAAGEVLKDRVAGRAEEPAVPEEEPPLPPPSLDPYSLAFIVGLASLGAAFSAATRAFLIPGSSISEWASPDMDQPVPFGPKLAWLALDTTDSEAVATGLGLAEPRPADWEDGINAAHNSSVFVTPPVADWTLAVGVALFPPGRAEAFVKPLLERLSGQFGEAQYFCTHRDVELHVWARAWQGQLVRGYGWLGQKGITLWDEGTPTKEERDLGFRFIDGRSTEGANPEESCVLQLACLWSVDPTTLDEYFKEPSKGLLGNVPWSQNRGSP